MTDTKENNLNFYIAEVNKKVKKFEKDTDRPLYYFVRTFGCQQNDSDSEIAAALFEKMGFRKAEDIASADLVLFNTCSVRENADQRFYGHLGNLKTWRKEGKWRHIGVMGCIPSQEIHRATMKDKFPFIDFLLKAGDMLKIPRALYLSWDSAYKDKVVDLSDEATVDNKVLLAAKRKNKHRALISIMSGCNNFCTYCIVPYTRGRERSKDAELILAEAKLAVKEGAKELMLIGQNVNSYGNDRRRQGDSDFPSFAQLLAAIAQIEGLSIVRYMTSHPKDLSDDLIHTIAQYETIEPHIHLPLQSGSNRILKRMHRQYTAEQYMSLVAKLRKARPGISISTDLIVGFPGEREEDFQETLNVMQEVKFDSAFTFIYSRRSGTPAAKMKQSDSDEVIHERFERLLDLQNKHSYESNKKFIDREISVLVNGLSKANDGSYSARSRDDRLVNFYLNKEISENSKKKLAEGGSEVKVKVLAAKPYSLTAEYLETIRT